jgi:glycosyltransferase involved in cell wall biosynthesis
MKILLLGEFSGFFKNLKDGFRELGHDVTLIAAGDVWKKIDGADISLESKHKGLLRKIDITYKYIKNLKYMKNHDVVLIINPNFFKKGIGHIVLNNVIKYNKNIYLSSCGDDVEYIKHGLAGNYKYWPFMNWCPEYKKTYYQTNFEKSIHNKLARAVNGVIPNSLEYAEAWRSSVFKDKVKRSIPLPINISNIEYSIFDISGKIIFFHGLNRECFKGTEYIREAMEYIEKKYPDSVECIIEGGLPLDEYLELMSKTHIVLDQSKAACGYGSMNALYAMAQGKVVMSGVAEKCLNEFDIKSSPVVHIEPDAKQIIEQMEYIIKNRGIIPKLQSDSRKFVELNHDTIMIAEKYMNIFNNKE